jgi:hypothetical protein
LDVAQVYAFKHEGAILLTMAKMANLELAVSYWGFPPGY